MTSFEHVWHFAMGGFSGYCLRQLQLQHHAAKRRRVLHQLSKAPEMPGLELLLAAKIGRSGYTVLFELEQEGLIQSRSDGEAHPERGGRGRRYYQLTKLGIGTLMEGWAR